MELTAEQEQAIRRGEAVQVNVAGSPCIVLRKDVYERGEALDFSPWSAEEINLLASETANLLAEDGFEETDNS